MSYSTWFNNHAQKHYNIVKKISHLQKEDIIKYFNYDNMQKQEPSFCRLYEDNKKCHDIKELNCYLCACPYFRFNDNGFYTKNGKKVFSYCSINSKDGKEFVGDDAIHQDCSKCLVPHSKDFISKTFSKNWKDIMSDVKKIN